MPFSNKIRPDSPKTEGIKSKTSTEQISSDLAGKTRGRLGGRLINIIDEEKEETSISSETILIKNFVVGNHIETPELDELFKLGSKK